MDGVTASGKVQVSTAAPHRRRRIYDYVRFVRGCMAKEVIRMCSVGQCTDGIPGILVLNKGLVKDASEEVFLASYSVKGFILFWHYLSILWTVRTYFFGIITNSLAYFKDEKMYSIWPGSL